MLGKFLAARSNPMTVAALQAVRLPTQPIFAAFSSTTTTSVPPPGNKNKGTSAGSNVSKPVEKKVDLWQKIKAGVANTGKKPDGRNFANNNNSNNKKDGQQKQYQKRPEGSANPSGQADKRTQGPYKPRPYKPYDGEKSGEAKSTDGAANNSSGARPQQFQQRRPSGSRPPGANNRGPPRAPGSRPPGNRPPGSRPPGSRPPGSRPPNSSKPPFRPRRPVESRSESGSDAGAPFSGPRRRRGGRESESSEQSSTSYSDRPREIEIAEADAALLFDDDFFVEKIRKDGGRWVVDDEEADFVDNLLSKAYLESVHTSDHSFRELYTSPGFNSRFKLPKTRSIHQLRCALEPKINAAPDSEGYKYATQAWTVLQRNNYYTDRQKRQIVNGIATMVNDLLVKSKDANLEAVDEAIDPDYYLGPEELREEVAEDAEEVELRNKRIAAEAERRAKENAAVEEEWDSDAVVDEDELEAINAAKK